MPIDEFDFFFIEIFILVIKGLTAALAIDCEMVGTLDGYSQSSNLARVSIVNEFGHCVYDKFVKPTEEVIDYRTWVSGIRPEDIENGEDFKKVREEIVDMVKGRILVGHSIKNDLDILMLKHPAQCIRDVASYKPFR